MSAHTIGLWSGLLVFLSIIPYAIRAYQGQIRPVLTSWALWALIGLAILLTYRSSGAGANAWPAIFGFTNPTLITVMSFWRRGQWKKPNTAERICFVLGLISLAIWLVLRQRRDFAEIALYIAVIADFFAAIPTLLFVWTEPTHDRPFAWVLFSVGYLLAVFAIPENTFANWILPLYMGIVGLAIALPLVVFRIKRKSPLGEWA